MACRECFDISKACRVFVLVRHQLKIFCFAPVPKQFAISKAL